MFQMYIPHAPLAQYVECLWYIKDTVIYQREHILPTGTIELMLNFGAPFRVYDHDESSKFILNQKAWIAGLQTEYIINEPLGETHMMGIRIKPHALSLLLKPDAHEFHNQLIDMDLLWGGRVQDLREQLYELPTPQQKFLHLEQVLIARLLPEHSALNVVQYAVQHIAQKQGRLSVRDLSEDIGISHKHLIHRFKQLVGISPKAFDKVMRFQSVLRSINPRDDIDWSAIAMQSDYYDQSHFNKDFATFTGMSPTQYMVHRRDIFGDTLEQGDDVHFVPVG